MILFNLNLCLPGTKTLYVARAQKKAERQEFLKRLYEERRNEQIKKYMVIHILPEVCACSGKLFSIDGFTLTLFVQASNVYVKNIADDIDDAILGEHFSLCGTIMSAKVMCDDKGLSKGFGFVCFSSPDEASKAVNTLHGILKLLTLLFYLSYI